MDRRSFLAGGAAALATLALPRATQARGQPTVAIVGGGIAGLNCALTLRDRGVAATVFEASGRVGGRMFSSRAGYWEAAQVSEWCGELIDSGHWTVRHLAHRYGLALDDLLAAEPKGSTETYRVGARYYSKAQADDDFQAVVAALDADLKAADYPTRYDAFTSAGAALDRTSVFDWIATRVPGGHASPLGQVLDLAYAIEYGADTVDQSALNLVYLLGYQPNPHDLAMFGESDERFHVRGGNQRLPEAIAADLGPAVQPGMKLVALRQTSAGSYRLTFQRGFGTQEVTADWVVLAVPFAVLAEVDTSGAGFDGLKRRAIAELGRGRNGKLQLQFQRRGWLGAGPWPGIANGSSYADTGYQASWEVSRAQPGEPGILVLYSGGSPVEVQANPQPFASATSAAVLQDAHRGLDQLAPIYPGLAWNGKATSSLPHLSPLFGASYAYYRVGQYTAFGGYEKARQGGVLFCGEHTSQDFQGFMEGGASEGARAARELLALLRRGAARERATGSLEA